jgi:hypothetical protein
VNSRELIYSTLFALVADAAEFTTTSREARLWSDVAPAEMPALFQQQGNQTATTNRPAPTKYLLTVDLIIYACEATAGDNLTVTVLNNLVDAVIAKLDPPPGMPCQTLGGLVTDVRVQGAIDVHEGRNDNGRIGIAVIPVEILANV